MCKTANLKKSQHLVFKTNCRLMQVKAPPPLSILLYFWTALSYMLPIVIKIFE